MDKGTGISNESSSCGWWIRVEQEFLHRRAEQTHVLPLIIPR